MRRGGKRRQLKIPPQLAYAGCCEAGKTDSNVRERAGTKFRIRWQRQRVTLHGSDHVLYLKHNRNAQAIASLKGEAVSIQNDIARLIEELNASIQQADSFIKQMQ